MTGSVGSLLHITLLLLLVQVLTQLTGLAKAAEVYPISNQRVVHVVRHKYPDGTFVDKVLSGPGTPLTVEDVIRQERPPGRAIVKHRAALYAVPPNSPLGSSLAGHGTHLGSIHKVVETRQLPVGWPMAQQNPPLGAQVGNAAGLPYIVSTGDRPMNVGPLSNAFLAPQLLYRQPTFGGGAAPLLNVPQQPGSWQVTPITYGPGPGGSLTPSLNLPSSIFASSTTAAPTAQTVTEVPTQTERGEIIMPDDDLPAEPEQEWRSKVKEPEPEEELEREEISREPEPIEEEPPIEPTPQPVPTVRPSQRFIDRVGVLGF